MTAFSIRRAGPDDAEAVTAMHLQSWREAYSHLLPDVFFDRKEMGNQKERVQARRRFLADSFEGPSTTRMWMGFDDGGVFRGNPRAEQFYRKNGFAPDGAAKQAGPRLGRLEEFRMVRR